MATIADLTVRIGATTTDLNKQLNAVKRNIEKTFGKDALKFSKKVAKGMVALGGVMVGLGVKSIALAGELRTTQRAFETMLGSADAAKQMIDDLRQLDDISVLGFEDLSEGAQRLLAFKFAAQDVIPILDVVGNASAALGKGAEGVDRITLALSQMQAKGRVQGQEMLQLAEAGINAYDYLADHLGMSVPQLMDEISKGAVSSTTAINAILLGMQKDYGGAMQKMADETPAVWDTIVSNVKQIFGLIGQELDEALGINDLLKRVRDYLVRFRQSVEQVGIKQTLANMIPPGVKVAIIGIATTLLAIAVPAITTFAVTSAKTAIMFAAGWAKAIVPLLPIIGIITALGALAYMVWKNWEPLGDLFGSLFRLIGNTIKIAVESWKVIFFTAVTKILEGITKLFSFFGAKSPVEQWQKNMEVALEQAKANVADTKEEIKTDAAEIGNAWDNLGDSVKQTVTDAVEGVKNFFVGDGSVPEIDVGINTEFTGLTGDTGSGDAVLKQKAADISKSIEDEWINVTKTEEEQLDIWYQKQLDTLNESKDANENYQRDLERLNQIYKTKKDKLDDELIDKAKSVSQKIGDEWGEFYQNEYDRLDSWYAEQLKALDETKEHNENYQRDLERLEQTYSARRKKIINDEAKARIRAWDQVEDYMAGTRKDGQNLTGVDKEVYDLTQDYEDTVKDIKRHWRDAALEFESMTETQQKDYLAALDAHGVAYKITEEGKLDFTEQINAQIKAEEEQFYSELNALHYNHTKYKEQLDQAYADGHIQTYMALLNNQYQELDYHLKGQQALMDYYRQLWEDSHLLSVQNMVDVWSLATDSMASLFDAAIKDMFSEVKTLDDAWKNIKSTILNTLRAMVAEWLASKISMWAAEKLFGGKQVASSTAQASSIAAAWAPAASMVSLATFGANAGPAMAGIATTTAVAIGLSKIPALAEGGITTGPTLAMIGEGKYREAVLPLNKQKLEKVGLKSDQQPVHQSLNITIQALDGKSVKRWLEDGGGDQIRRYFVRYNKSFGEVV